MKNIKYMSTIPKTCLEKQFHSYLFIHSIAVYKVNENEKFCE